MPQAIDQHALEKAKKKMKTTNKDKNAICIFASAHFTDAVVECSFVDSFNLWPHKHKNTVG